MTPDLMIKEDSNLYSRYRGTLLLEPNSIVTDLDAPIEITSAITGAGSLASIVVLMLRIQIFSSLLGTLKSMGI